jgi:hypothetical protein
MLRGLALTAITGLLYLLSLTAKQNALPGEQAKKTIDESILGTWTEVYREQEGKLKRAIPDPVLLGMADELAKRVGRQAGKGGYLFPEAWLFIIGRDKVQTQADRENPSPSGEFLYELKLGSAPATIDLIQIDHTGKKLDLPKQEGIYFVKDDCLLMCFGSPRPKRFVTSVGSNNELIFLRRGKFSK